MERRDIIIVAIALVLSIALAWAGTEYVVDHVVVPLTKDDPAANGHDHAP